MLRVKEPDHLAMKQPDTSTDSEPKLKPRTKAFLDRLISNPSMTQADAWLDTHVTTNRRSANVTANQTLAKPSSQIYLKKHVQIARETIVEIARNKEAKHGDRIKASQDILDRMVGKAVQKVESTSTNLNVNVEASQALSDQFTEFLKGQSQI